MDEAKLIEKLGLIEALFAGATTPGEREAADRARERIVARLREVEQSDPPIEYRFTLSNTWSRRVLVTLLRRYGIKPYRYKGQRYTTVMAVVPQSFVDETLWPQFERFDEVLTKHLTEVTDRVVAQVLQTEVAEADVVAGPRQLPLDAGVSAGVSSPPRSGATSPETSGSAGAAPRVAPPPPRPIAPPPASTNVTESAARVGRNSPCPCGSGKKYKRCCGRPGQR